MIVKVYSTTNCPRCRQLKEYLHRENIEFTELNMEDTCVSADLIMKNIAVLSAPILEVDDVLSIESQLFDDDTLSVDKVNKVLGR